MAKEWDIAIYVRKSVQAAVSLQFSEIRRKWKIDYTFASFIDMYHKGENLPDVIDKCAKTSGTYQFRRLVFIVPSLAITENEKNRLERKARLYDLRYQDVRFISLIDVFRKHHYLFAGKTFFDDDLWEDRAQDIGVVLINLDHGEVMSKAGGRQPFNAKADLPPIVRRHVSLCTEQEREIWVFYSDEKEASIAKDFLPDSVPVFYAAPHEVAQFVLDPVNRFYCFARDNLHERVHRQHKVREVRKGRRNTKIFLSLVSIVVLLVAGFGIKKFYDYEIRHGEGLSLRNYSGLPRSFDFVAHSNSETWETLMPQLDQQKFYLLINCSAPSYERMPLRRMEYKCRLDAEHLRNNLYGKGYEAALVDEAVNGDVYIHWKMEHMDTSPLINIVPEANICGTDHKSVVSFGTEMHAVLTEPCTSEGARFPGRRWPSTEESSLKIYDHRRLIIDENGTTFSPTVSITDVNSVAGYNVMLHELFRDADENSFPVGGG